MRLRRLCAALAIAGLAAASRPAAADELAASDPAQVEQGKALYAEHCSHCHGFNMVNPGTVSFDLRRFPPDDKARFVDSVTHGKNNRMPPWGDILSAQEIDQLWAYIRTGGKS